MQHPIHRLKAELANEKNEHMQTRNSELLEKFCQSVGNDIMIILANTPFEQWPRIAVEAFNHQKSKTPTLAAMYKENHRPIQI